MQSGNEVTDGVDITLQIARQQEKSRGGHPLKKLLLNGGVHPRDCHHHESCKLRPKVHRPDCIVDALLCGVYWLGLWFWLGFRW